MFLHIYRGLHTLPLYIDSPTPIISSKSQLQQNPYESTTFSPSEFLAKPH